jgi:hypothetical protein
MPFVLSRGQTFHFDGAAPRILVIGPAGKCSSKPNREMVSFNHEKALDDKKS